MPTKKNERRAWHQSQNQSTIPNQENGLSRIGMAQSLVSTMVKNEVLIIWKNILSLQSRHHRNKKYGNTHYKRRNLQCMRDGRKPGDNGDGKEKIFGDLYG